MNKAGVTAFAKQMANTLRDVYGTAVTIAGVSYTAAVSVGEPELNLETGGYEKPVDFILRLPRTDLSAAPPTSSPVVIENVTYRLLSIRRSFGSLSQEWIMEVGTA
tara:strand:+ start:41 stop:358 length:318 start_codon:yes stop_codon:yes gene_type:complete